MEVYGNNGIFPTDLVLFTSRIVGNGANEHSIVVHGAS
jgi:hypothetical protein